MEELTGVDGGTARSTSKAILTRAFSYKQYDAFKSKRCTSYSLSKCLERHFSLECREFSGSSLKKLATPSPSCTAIQLGTGRPNPEFFPWKSCTTPSPEASCGIFSQSMDYSLSSGLDYGHAAGSPQLLRFIVEHVELVHDPPYSDWGTCLSAGSTSALEIALRVFCNRGDTIVAEQFTYAGFLEVAALLGVSVKGIQLDNEGIKPDSLRCFLQSWDNSLGARPSVLYMIPSGQNPTGTSQTAKRRAEIYSIAEAFDLIIIEDDPYYFLCLESSKRTSKGETNFLTSLTPSYVSIDVSGRVVRLDSMSKIIAPGLRVGWVTAKDSVIAKFLSYHEVTTAFVNGPSQMMLYNLFDESWGHKGFFCWLEDISRKYGRRRDIMIEACQTHLPADICTWAVPSHGIYVWVHIDTANTFQSSKRFNDNGEYHFAIEDRILVSAMRNGVQVTGGSMFKANSMGTGGVAFRLTYATAEESMLSEGVQRFADAVKEVLGHRKSA